MRSSIVILTTCTVSCLRRTGLKFAVNRTHGDSRWALLYSQIENPRSAGFKPVSIENGALLQLMEPNDNLVLIVGDCLGHLLATSLKM